MAKARGSDYLMMTVYRRDEFELMLREGWADYGINNRPCVRDADWNWHYVRITEVGK